MSLCYAPVTSPVTPVLYVLVAGSASQSEGVRQQVDGQLQWRTEG